MSIRQVITIATVTLVLHGLGHTQSAIQLLPRKSAPQGGGVILKESKQEGRRTVARRRTMQGFRTLTPEKSKPQEPAKFRLLPRRSIIVVPGKSKSSERVFEVLPPQGGRARTRVPAKESSENTARRRIIIQENPSTQRRRTSVRSGEIVQQPRIRRRVTASPSPSSTVRLEARMAELTREIRELRHLLERLERRIPDDRRARRGRRR